MSEIHVEGPVLVCGGAGYIGSHTVRALEERVAELFGKEAALFFPSGTMANQTAIKLHTHPGEQLICDHYAHVYNYEGGGVSFNSHHSKGSSISPSNSHGETKARVPKLSIGPAYRAARSTNRPRSARSGVLSVR